MDATNAGSKKNDHCSSLSDGPVCCRSQIANIIQVIVLCGEAMKDERDPLKIIMRSGLLVSKAKELEDIIIKWNNCQRTFCIRGLAYDFEDE